MNTPYLVYIHLIGIRRPYLVHIYSFGIRPPHLEYIHLIWYEYLICHTYLIWYTYTSLGTGTPTLVYVHPSTSLLMDYAQAVTLKMSTFQRTPSTVQN